MTRKSVHNATSLLATLVYCALHVGGAAFHYAPRFGFHHVPCGCQRLTADRGEQAGGATEKGIQANVPRTNRSHVDHSCPLCKFYSQGQVCDGPPPKVALVAPAHCMLPAEDSPTAERAEGGTARGPPSALLRFPIA